MAQLAKAFLKKRIGLANDLAEETALIRVRRELFDFHTVDHRCRPFSAMPCTLAQQFPANILDLHFIKANPDLLVESIIHPESRGKIGCARKG
jgi:hypothetical protein